jgi:hypothetical protein
MHEDYEESRNHDISKRNKPLIGENYEMTVIVSFELLQQNT